MSLFAEFQVPAAAFALYETLTVLPEARIEVERVVATDGVLTPYFRVTTADFEAFETAAEADPSVHRLRRIDGFEDTALYHAEWTESVESVVHAYTRIGGVVLEAVGSLDGWRFQMRFDNHDQLRAFQDHCTDTGIEFDLIRLHELTQPLGGEQYGLTDRQYDALRTAWELGYFDTPRVTTLDTVAADLGITQQSLSELLRRGHHELIESTLMIASPDGEETTE